MAAPTAGNAGSNVTNAGAVAVALPAAAPAVGDRAFIVIAHRDVAVGTPTPSGGSGFGTWAQVSGSPVVQGAARLTVWTAVLTSTSPTAPTISDSGDHQQIRVIYTNHASGTPAIHATQTSVDATSDTSGAAACPTTTVADCLILLFGAGDTPDANGTAEYSTPTNASLSSIVEIADNSVVTGGGSSKLLAKGVKASAGAIGDWAYTKTTAGVKAHLVVAVSPPASPTATTVARVSLETLPTPDTRTAHSIKLRARKASGSGSVLLNAALYEGATNRSGDLASSALTTSFAEYTLAISDANAANITSYADLELRLWATCAAGDVVDVDVAEIWLATPAGTAAIGGASSVRGGGLAASTGKKAATGSSSVRGGGAVVSVGREGQLAASSVTGGGAASSTGRKAASSSSSVRGGGSVVSIGSAAVVEQHSGASSVRGGGSVASTVRKTAASTSTVRGGGAAASSARKSSSSTSSVRGGGLVSTATSAGAASSSAVTGGGAASSSARKGAQTVSTVRGGGSVVSTGTQLQARSGSSSVRGGGATSSSGRKAASATSSVRGGGSAAAAAAAGASSASTVQGGGSVVSVGRKSATGVSSVRGGGAVASTGSQVPAKTGSSSVRGGGSVVSVGRKAAAGSSSVRSGPSTDVGNVLPNPTFDSVVFPWATGGAFDLTAPAGELVSTRNAVASSDGNMGFVIAIVPKAGRYLATVRVFVPNDWDGGDFRIAFDGLFAGFTGLVMRDVPSTARGWQTVAAWVTIAPTDLAGAFVIRTLAMPSTGIAAKFDDAVFARQSDGQKAAFGSSSVRGGGSVASSAAAARRSTSTVRGGGSVSSTGTQQIAKTGSSSVRGGGLVAGVGKKATTSTSTARGGGTVTSSTRKSSTSTSSVRGGGFVTSTGSQQVAKTGASSVRGGGRPTGSGVKAAARSSTVTGGGRPTGLGRKASTATSAIRGGGFVSSTGKSARTAASTVRGGGYVTTATISGEPAAPPITWRTGNGPGANGVTHAGNGTGRTLVDGVTNGRTSTRADSGLTIAGMRAGRVSTKLLEGGD